MTRSGHGVSRCRSVSYPGDNLEPGVLRTVTRFLPFCVVLLVLGHPEAAQTQQHYRFEHLTLEEGVAHNLAYCMLQDRAGFLWFGTMYGLVRHDGSTFVTYRYHPGNPNSLSNDDIVSLLEDTKENLWIGTFGGGLNKIDRATGKMVRYTHDPRDPASITNGIVWSICEDHAGKIWMATNGGGLEMLDPATDTFTHFRHDSTNANSLSEDVIFSVVEDEDHALWIGTKGSGIDVLDPSRTTFARLRNVPGDRTSLSSNDVRKLYIDRGGEIWVGTYGGGLNRFLAGDRTFHRYEHDPANERSLSLNHVNAVLRDRSGICWVGTPYGLNRLDPATGEITRFFHSKTDPNSLSSSNISALMEDASGLIWVGSYQGGVDKLFAGEKRFRHLRHEPADPATLSGNAVSAMVEDHAGVLWIGTNEGLDASRDSGRTFRHFTWDQKDATSLSGKVVSSIAEDARGVLWVGTRRGVSRMGPERSSFTHLRHDPEDPGSISSDVITALLASTIRPDELWIGTAAGLNRYDTRSKTITRYRTDRTDSTSLSNDYVLSVFEDREGAIWVGTFGGLNRLGPERKAFTRYVQDPRDPKSISNNYAHTMLEDREGVLWVGTGGGLNRFDRESGTFSLAGRREGIPNAVICGMIEEPAGTLWISTYRGISRYEPAAGRAANFDVSDGLQSNMFTPGAYCRRAGGELLFGGINGANAFRPEDAPKNTFIPPVAITSFMLFDNTQSNLMSELPGRSSVTLSHTQNFFAISFSALDYTEPSKNQYTFKLEGFDDDWIPSGNVRFARYMNLSPGEYVFKVKGSNNSGVWNETVSVFTIIITPPFWRTWWFYSLSAAAFCGSILMIYHYRVRQKVRRLTELERVRNAENVRVRKHAADDFHDEFGHKLTKISLLSQVIRRALNGGAPELAEQLDKVIQTSSELSMGMRDFLWTLNPEKDTVHDVMIRLKDFGDELFNSCGVGFEVTGLSKELEDLQLTVDWRRHLTLLFKEAMHNAAKHAGCTAVKLTLSVVGDRVRVRLDDDGRGFDPSQKTDGQGLTSMANRAGKIGGTLRVASSKGAGTSVEFEAALPPSRRTA